jgi:hypothetical protein
MSQGKPYSARLADAMKAFAGNIHADGSPTKRVWPGVRLTSWAWRRRMAPTDLERPLRPAERLRRRRRVEKLCRQNPGTVVLGRYGVVQYPNIWEWPQQVWNWQGKLVSPKNKGKMYK